MNKEYNSDISKLIKSIKLLFLFIIVVYGTNFAIDPANIVHRKYVVKAADILARGQNATNLQNLDDRLMMRQYAQVSDKQIDTLVVGSSRCMQFTKEIVGDNNSFCAGVTGADLRDCIGAYTLFKNAGHRPKRVVFGAEYWFLSHGNLDNRALTEEYEVFCNETDNTPLKTTPKIIIAAKEMFSFSYFQSSISFLLKRNGMPSLAATDKADNMYATRRSDGSYSYEQSYREQDPEKVSEEVRKYCYGNSIAIAYTGVNEQLQKQLEDFIKVMQDDGVEIVIQLSPFHPIYYKYMLTNSHYDSILATESYYYSLEDKYGIQVYGGYNPTDFGMVDSDFYDSQHPSAQGVYKYYGVKHKI